jgi:glutamine amidotransferase
MIAVVDYGMGNLRSVQKALQRAGGDARIVQTGAELSRADKIVLPGVGAFRDAIDRLRSHGLDQALTEAIRGGTPLLGICLGLQMLFEVSHEDGEHRGLGIFRGQVVRFDFPPAPQGALRVPQIGWNQIRWDRPVPMLEGIASGAYVYFCHSYYVRPAEAGIIATTTDYGGTYASSVWKDNIFATQFHPEKSQAVGLRIMENFVRL